MLAKINEAAHSRKTNIVVAIFFAVFSVVGFHYGGTTFLTEWAGGIAAAIAIACLIFKTQGYWFWALDELGVKFKLLSGDLRTRMNKVKIASVISLFPKKHSANYSAIVS